MGDHGEDRPRTDDGGFDRTMSDADWAAVHDRQAARGGHLPRFFDLLGLEAGDRVLELGCGPGHATARLADRVAPGRVVAVDRRRGALDYLRDVAAPDVAVADPVLADAAALPLRFAAPTPALCAFVLHHVESPVDVIASVAASLPAGSPLLVAEYDPDAPGDVGPPADHRLAPAAVRGWLADAGFAVERTADLPEEAFAVLARREAGGL